MAKLDVNIVTSMVGKGLEREYLLLKDLLTAHDMYVNVYHYTNIAGSNYVRADINLFLEVMMPNVLSLSRRNVLLPNCEWWHPINDQYLDRITEVWCKTLDCYRIWCQKVGDAKCKYIGFESRDLYDESVAREERFLHAAGESEFKNTEAVIGAWKGGIWPIQPGPPLTIVTRQPRFLGPARELDNVTVIERASEDELKRLMNSHRYHILPSEYEGFGHLIHEGIGCGALVITTNAPPMNEFPGVQTDWGVNIVSATTRSLAQLKKVTPLAIGVACCKAQAANEGDKIARSMAARQMFLAERNEFRNRILRAIGV